MSRHNHQLRMRNANQLSDLLLKNEIPAEGILQLPYCPELSDRSYEARGIFYVQCPLKGANSGPVLFQLCLEHSS